MLRFLSLLIISVFAITSAALAGKTGILNPKGYHVASDRADFRDGYVGSYKEVYGDQESRETSDPNHKGFEITSFTATHEKTGEKVKDTMIHAVFWKDVDTDCKPCKDIAREYNYTVKKLLHARYERRLADNIGNKADLNYIKSIGAKELAKELVEDKDGNVIGQTNTIEGQAAMMASAMQLEDIKRQRIAAMDAIIKALEPLEKDLRVLLKNCEKQCKGEESEIIIGEPGALILPYPWKGPYSTECWRCEKLVAHLNSLPDLTYPLLAQKIRLEASLKELETNLEYTKAYLLISKDGRDNAHLQEDALDSIKRVKDAIKEIDRKLRLIKINFEETLALYNDCEKTCKPAKTTSCTFPDSKEPAITVGSNGEVGSGAALKNKAKDQAKGMAMGAIGGLLGGGGLSLGGGGDDFDGIGSPGGGGGQKGPKTQKDPTSGSFTDVSAGDTDLEIRAGFTDDGFVVSTNIDDSPGDGTFQVMWLEDVHGNIYLPIKYIIISLWRDWKLTVWWTYDRWVDGEHVESRKGRETTFGRQELGTFIFRFQDKEGFKNAIWYILGFETAKKGIQHLGSVFQLPPSVSTGPCPVRLVVHVTLPNGDPVMTQPVSVTVGGDTGQVPVKGWGADGAQAKTQVQPPSGILKDGTVLPLPDNVTGERIGDGKPATHIQVSPKSKSFND